MSLIHDFMPRPLLRQVDRVSVACGDDRAWRAARDVDLYRLPFVHALFNLRLFPQALRAWLDGRVAALPRHAFIDDIAQAGNAFQILAEHGESIVVGAIGKFWQPNIDFVRVEPSAFAAFAAPGYGKVVWSLSAAPRASGGSWVTIDLRVDCTDDEARAAFSRYWHLVGPFSHIIRRRLLHSLEGELGHREPLALRRLEGDELLKAARLQRTHDLCIEVPPEKLWPWLVQMGCHRGGWYSYDALDNGGFPSADRIEPALQTLAVGDPIPARLTGGAHFTVLRIEPNRTLVLGSPRFSDSASTGLQTTWSFNLERIDADATDLIVRVRAAYPPRIRHTLRALAIGLAHEVMERKQLRSLKARVEAVEMAALRPGGHRDV